MTGDDTIMWGSQNSSSSSSTEDLSSLPVNQHMDAESTNSAISSQSTLNKDKVRVNILNYS